MWVRIPAWPVATLVSFSKTLNHNCFVLRMGRKALDPVCCVMHVKEPRTLIVKEKGLAPVFLDSRLEHPAGWMCARYKSSVLLLLMFWSDSLYIMGGLLGTLQSGADQEKKGDISMLLEKVEPICLCGTKFNLPCNQKHKN